MKQGPEIGPGLHAARWNRADLLTDSGLYRRLSMEEMDGLQRALNAAEAAGKPLLEMSPEDFPISAAVRHLLDETVKQCQQGRGFQVLRGFPVLELDIEQARLLFWGLGLQMGVARPQGKSSQFWADVRDAGVDYRGKAGRGYSSRSALDFHSDGSDLVGLMCLRTAVSGGTSLISSALRAHEEMVATRPDLVAELHGLFTFSRQGEEAPEEAPYYAASIFGERDGRLACRYTRNHIRSAQQTFPEVPRLTERQIEALDLLDATLAREDMCLHMTFEPGDMQFINNHAILHSRTDYEDHEKPELKRHLLRLWLSIPQGQPLPLDWRDAYKDVEPCAVRGGFRGQHITDQARRFESRLARAHRMRFHIYDTPVAALS